MRPNKGGFDKANSLPVVEQTQSYQAGDVLVSNIRPYFQKIVFARDSGGCSNDILVFRASARNDARFLYYVLSSDSFFNYATATSKGTKMPRGDKKAIMDYPVPSFELTTQKKIASLLSSIDEKIETNTKANSNLEQQAFELFNSLFACFERTAGVMPADWRKGTLGEIADITSGKRPPMKQTTISTDASIPLVGAASIMGYTNTTLYNEPILVTGRVGTHGVVQRFQTPCWASDNTLVIKSRFYEFAYQVLQRVDYVNMNRGSTQPLITQTDLKRVPIIIPNESTLLEFEATAGMLMSLYEANRRENELLAKLRDTLLPKLLSGELDVSSLPL